jgi:peroxiredoxin Q/BCP
MSDRILRKRAAPPPAPEPPAKKKAAAKPKPEKSVVETIKESVAKVEKSVKAAVGGKATNGTSSKAPEVGDVVDIATFGGDFETQDGRKVTFSELLEESKAGIVLFTYPKASTPGW